MNDIDLAAEREAAAIESLAAMLGQEPPLTNLNRAIARAREAAARRLPAPRVYRYEKLLATKRWCEISEAFGTGRTPRPTRLDWSTPEDRARRVQKRARRFALLVALGKRSARELVDRPTAVKLIGVSRRILERGITTGELTTVRSNGQLKFQVGQLAAFLSRRLQRRGRDGRLPERNAAMAS